MIPITLTLFRILKLIVKIEKLKMKKYTLYILIASLTFIIGAIFSIQFFSNNLQENYLTLINEPEITNDFTSNLPELEEPEDEYLNLFENNLTNAKIKLQMLLEYKNVNKSQTIYVSKDSIYAYWVEDKSLIIVSAIEPENAKFGIFEKAYIDLETDVVPTGKYGNLGCCLHEKDWVDEIIAKCRKGNKIKL